MSQFLVRPFFFGAYQIDQRYRKVAEGAVNQFMASFSEYLAIQDGAAPSVLLIIHKIKNQKMKLFHVEQFAT